MVNEKVFAAKIAAFFNSLTPEEAIALRRFTMSRKWAAFFDSRINNQKIEL